MKTKILFVCSGNVFRSMSCEYSLKKYCKDNNIKDIEASSAGISVSCKEISRHVKDEFKNLEIDVSNHKPRKVSKEILDENDLIVCMNFNHQEFLKKEFNIDSYLFYEICFNSKEPVLDNCEVYDNYHGFLSEMYDRQMVRNVYRDMFFFLRNYKKFI